MAKTLSQLIFDIATKAGIPDTDPDLIALTENKELFSKEVPEKLVSGIEKQLISITDAKNNHPDIKFFYKKQALDGVDGAIEKILEELADEDVKKSVLAVQNTYERVPLLASKIKELESKKANAKQTDKKEFQEQIDGLHAQLRIEKEKIPQIEKNADERVLKFKKDYTLRSHFNNYKTTIDDFDPEVRALTLFNLINKELQEKKAQFAFDEHDNFILLNLDGTNHYGDDNKQIDAKSFIEKTLSRNKLLKVNDQTPPGNGDNNNNGQRQQQPQQGGAGNGATQKNHALSGLTQRALQDIEKNASQPVMGL